MNIQQIAKLANVSPSTVSKVMNGNDKDISEATRARVLRVISENNYVPYSKFLKKEGLQQRVIGILLEEGYPYHCQITYAVNEATSKLKYSVAAYTFSDSDSRFEALEEIMRLNPAGIIVYSSQQIGEDLKISNPFYITDTNDFSTPKKNTFFFSKADSGRLAAEYLLSEGHRQISYISDSSGKVILTGIEEYLRNRGGFSPDSYFISDSVEEISKFGFVQCVNDQVSAVICGSPAIACQAAAYAVSIGMRIPEDISILSIGDSDNLSLLFGGISAVNFPIKEMATAAAKHILSKNQPKASVQTQHVFHSSIIERHSVAPPMLKKTGGKIIAVGSMNMDVTLEVGSIPIEGETQIAESIITLPGGKGANQAIGVGKLGGQVSMIGRLGTDPDGRALYKNLTDNGVNVDGVEFDPITSSGKAFIYIDSEGENTIVVHQGANLSLNHRQLERYSFLFASAKYCLLSLEISTEAVSSTVELCRRHGVKILLKPSAVDEIDEKLLKYVDFFIPNEAELQRIVPGDMSIEDKAELLLKKGADTVIVTLGKHGCYLRQSSCSEYFPSAPFTAVDTTGGADSFISALAVCLSEGADLIYSIIFATYAAGLTITRYGVQEALPNRKTMEIYKNDIQRQYRKYKEKVT